jgi:hypothetical protein
LAIDERELMRRRRVDAVFGMELGGGGSGGTASASGAGGAEDSSQEGAAEAEDGMADLLLWDEARALLNLFLLADRGLTNCMDWCRWLRRHDRCDAVQKRGIQKGRGGTR